MAIGGRAFFTRPFEPSSPEGKALSAKARRDVWPSEVRANLDGNKTTLVAWAGVVKQRDLGADGNVRILIEHHYWDWKEDHGPQPELYFLSPRGEGSFGVIYVLNGEPDNPNDLPVGSMAIVFGVPEQLGMNGQLVVLNHSGTITIAPSAFATDIWDYGRAFLEKGDMSDLKVLRMP